MVDVGKVVDSWVTLKEASEILGVSKQRVHTLIKKGRLRAIKISPQRLVVNLMDIVSYKKYSSKIKSAISESLSASFSADEGFEQQIDEHNVKEESGSMRAVNSFEIDD